MSDNVSITPGTGAVIATDDVAGVQYQRVKLDIGADGASSPVTAANPMPVALAGTTPVSLAAPIALDPASLAALEVISIANFPATQPISLAAPASVTTTVYAKSLVLKAAPGVLFGLSGYNSKTTEQFVQVHDAIAEPAAGAVPKVLVKVAPLSTFDLDFGVRGRAFSAGIVVCNSSTGPVATMGAADCWFDGQVG